MAFPFRTFKLELENALWRDEQTMPQPYPGNHHPAPTNRPQKSDPVKIQGNRVGFITRRSDDMRPVGEN